MYSRETKEKEKVRLKRKKKIMKIKKESTSLCYSLQDPYGKVTHDISFENVIRVSHVMEACFKMINRTSNATQHHAGVVRWLYVVIWCDVLNMFKRMIINDVTSDSFHQLLAKCAWRSQFRLQSVQICSLRKATTNKTYKKKSNKKD